MASAAEPARPSAPPGGRPHHGQCIFFMAGKVCLPTSCSGAHLAKADRPPCRAFATGHCPWAEGSCWFPHDAGAFGDKQPELPPFNLVLQITAGQAARLVDYLKEVFGGALLSEPVSMRGATLGQADDTVLLLQVENPGEVIRRLATDVLVANVAKRWYMPRVRSRSFEQAVGAVVASISALCASADARTAVLRIQCYPRADEAAFMDVLAPPLPSAAAAPPCPGVSLSLSPTAWNYIVACVHVGGWWCTSVECAGAGDGGGALQPWGNMAAKRIDVAEGCSVVSRAYYKLQEALCRTGYVTHPRMAIPPPQLPPASAEGAGAQPEKRGRGRGPTQVALTPADGGEGDVHVIVERWSPRVGLDIGASPGGWSQFMARLGFEAVYAVDPGDLAPELPYAPEGPVHHLRKQAVPALQELVEAGRLRGAVDLYVCDMNCEVPDTVGALRTALPLLAPGCVCVLTLKNFCGSRRRWEASCRDAVAAVADIIGPGPAGSKAPEGGVWLKHLMSNGAVEVTLVARLP